jgi:hypothetical protein
MFIGRGWGVDDMPMSSAAGDGSVSHMANVAEVKTIHLQGFSK